VRYFEFYTRKLKPFFIKALLEEAQYFDVKGVIETLQNNTPKKVSHKIKQHVTVIYDEFGSYPITTEGPVGKISRLFTL